MSLSRRTFIGGAAGAAIVTAPTASEALSPRDRLDLAVAELQAAAMELWPDIDEWKLVIGTEKYMPVLIGGFRPLGKSKAEPLRPAKSGVTV